MTSKSETHVPNINRIGQDLWPQHRKRLVQQALRVKDGTPVRLTMGEAETLARQETEREIESRLRLLELTDASQRRPQSRPHPNYFDTI